jgi:phospholipid/cholesterol/gamma-HCH transport system permease protein
MLVSSAGYVVNTGIGSFLKIVSAGILNLGQLVVLFVQIVLRFPLVFKNPGITLQQVMNVGVSSIPLIFVASIFTGAVTAESAEYQFRNFIPDRYIGTGVCLSVILELGPVLTGLVLAGRSSSAISAEIGSMKEKEELDAMQVLDLDPLRYLAMPRILSCIIMFPVLTIMSCFLAILGGWVDSIALLGLTTSTYVFGLRFLFDPYYVVICLTKAVAFGAIVALMGYFHGLTSGAGARGVGQATMKSVVSSSVLILIFDFIITYVMLA